MKITYYGQNSLSLEMGGATIIIDPFITENDLSKGKVGYWTQNGYTNKFFIILRLANNTLHNQKGLSAKAINKP